MSDVTEKDCIKVLRVVENVVEGMFTSSRTLCALVVSTPTERLHFSHATEENQKMFLSLTASRFKRRFIGYIQASIIGGVV
jgi:hypothetical protein